MDLLKDIGTNDQLIAARSENAVLNEMVKELSMKVKLLTVENQSLMAEVEMYRKEAAFPNFSNMALGKPTSSNGMEIDEAPDEFIKSGNNVFPSECAATLNNLHRNANILCCALDPSDTLLATGGADGTLTLCAWGGALAPTQGAADSVVQKAVSLNCAGPVICVDFSKEYGRHHPPITAAGCMDGSITLIAYRSAVDRLEARILTPSLELKCSKYIKCIAFSPSESMLVAASADGTAMILKILDLQDSGHVTVEVVQRLHLVGTPESICFSADGSKLICFIRDTPYLTIFDLKHDFEMSRVNLNRGSGVSVGGFDDHVSFAVMDMALSPNGKFLALATDTSRNIVIDVVSGKHIRNLYGHTNDGFSNPKIAWSSSGQYIFGNTQEDGSCCVWDVASASIVKRLAGHASPIRGLFSSNLTDTVVTTSFDKQTRIWLVSM